MFSESKQEWPISILHSTCWLIVFLGLNFCDLLYSSEGSSISQSRDVLMPLLRNTKFQTTEPALLSLSLSVNMNSISIAGSNIRTTLRSVQRYFDLQGKSANDASRLNMPIVYHVSVIISWLRMLAVNGRVWFQLRVGEIFRRIFFHPCHRSSPGIFANISHFNCWNQSESF